jgi:hypothetical protein
MDFTYPMKWQAKGYVTQELTTYVRVHKPLAKERQIGFLKFKKKDRNIGSISKRIFVKAREVDQEIEYEVWKPCMK